MGESGRDPAAVSLVGSYSPAAIYYEEADIVQYVRKDVPLLHRRIDGFLTLVLDLNTREPIGFALKGFKNFYLRFLRDTPDQSDSEFVRLTTVLEHAVHMIGDAVFNEDAYRTAREIAEHDKVELHELPVAA